ncbi:potassium channel family protein [Microlunatus parietis]|uniref:Trk system potassium uptake protein TrkA n=1 Tax=Microlunatus parietis TaxID=682979 RepID=A0A7Y9LBJ6_9ACTN|nr:TrkA family potassium uptake protein [Microlunatus parietis]NYE69901.1 trk system potassium uptake protein TrkA [Microlunatus parietis]
MAKFTLFGGTGPTNLDHSDAVVVIGLGRFGQALALELMETGAEVLGIDGDEDIVQSLNGQLTHVVQADATKEETLRQLAVPQFGRAVVGIGTDIEASLLTTSLLLRFSIAEIWAKAVSDAHGSILEQLGVHHVIYPEKDMGRRVAHLVRGRMQDYIEIGEDFALVKTTPNAELLGKALGDTQVRARHGVTVTAFRRPGQPWTYATAETVLHAGDTILVTGPIRNAEAFGQLS